MSALLVFCTCPDRETALRIARTLVEERLAACVNLLPGVTSIYRWHAAIEQGEEIQLLIKTSPMRRDELTRRVVALHPYELPEVLAVEAAAGLDRYLGWIGESTAPDAGD